MKDFSAAVIAQKHKKKKKKKAPTSRVFKITRALSTRQNNNDLKDYDEDEELNKIIAKIEREHISTMYDNHLNTKSGKKKVSRTLNPHIKINSMVPGPVNVAVTATFTGHFGLIFRFCCRYGNIY